MAEEQIKNSIRGFIRALMAGDEKHAISFVSDDAVWGKYKGTAEIMNYITRLKNVVKDYKITETGIGIVVQGDTGVIEHDFAGVTNGTKWEVPAMCVYEFRNDKIVNIRTFYDRLSIANQVAKGPIAKWIVNSVVKAMERGLR